MESCEADKEDVGVVGEIRVVKEYSFSIFSIMVFYWDLVCCESRKVR